VDTQHTSTWKMQATGVAQARPSGAPKQATEAKPSSRGDARAAERARTGGTKIPDPGKFAPIR
jgi:hypothetical protein